jgi:hypothetical protein
MNTKRRLLSLALGLLAVAAGAAAIWLGDKVGLWWGAALVGAVYGRLLKGWLRVLAAAALASLAGWGLDLLVQSTQADLGGVAGVVALIAGLPRADGPAILGVTLAFGLLLGLAGAWAGAALSRAAAAFSPRPAPVPVPEPVAVPASQD